LKRSDKDNPVQMWLVHWFVVNRIVNVCLLNTVAKRELKKITFTHTQPAVGG